MARYDQTTASSMWVVECPHCKDIVLIEQINCAIFRHGAFRDTMEQIPPHATEQQCSEWQRRNLIFGCGKPFRLVAKEKKDDPTEVAYTAVICEYI